MLQNGLDPLVTLRYLFLMDVVQLQRLPQRKDVLFPIVPNECFTDCLNRFLAAAVAESSQRRGVALTCNDRAHNAHACHPGDIRDDVMKLHIHLRQRFLHMLDVGGGKSNSRSRCRR